MRVSLLVAGLLCAICVERGHGYAQGRIRQVDCIMDYDPLDASGRPGKLHVPSVANFLRPKVQDDWWTEEHVEEYMRKTGTYRIGQSKIAGCGAIANRNIKKGEQIGMVWIRDPEGDKDGGKFAEMWPRHFTPWYGRAVNHCGTHDSTLQEMGDGSVWSMATRDIAEGEEITGDYNEAHRQFPLLVESAPESWKCPYAEGDVQE